MLHTTGRDLPHRARVRALARRAFFMVFLSFAGVSGLSTLPATAQSYSFSRVQIEGNARIEAATILSYLGIAKGDTVTAAQMNDAYQRLAGSGLFETVDVSPRGGVLVVKVQEYPTINRVSVEGNRRLKDAIFAPLLQSQPRHVYSPTTAELDAAAIVEVYQAQGRIAASVNPRIIRRSDNRVDLVFEVVEGRNVEVERLSFVGNRNYSDGRLRRVLETKQAGILRRLVRADTYTPDRVQFDKQVLTDFYRSRGYVDFRILAVNTELSRERNAFFLTFQVREGQRFKFGEITTTSDLADVDPATFQAVSKIRTGAYYNPAVLENTIARMERHALQQGLNFIQVEPRVTRNDRDMTLDIELVVKRGPRIIIERIDVKGNATTLDRVVRNQFRVVEGDPFNPREIREAAARIRALGFFSSTDVQAREGSAADQVIVDVNVEEVSTGSFTFGGAYSLEQGFGLNLAFSERNFLGRGQNLDMSLVSGVDNASFHFSFAEPNLLGRDLRLGIDANYTQTQQASEFYDTRLISLRPSLQFPTSANGRLTVQAFGDGADMLNVAPGASALIVTEAARGQQIGGGVGFGYTYDSRRTGLNPNAGVLFQMNSDFGGFGADYQYSKTTALLSGQARVMNEAVTLRASFEGGALVAMNGGASRATDRFFMGPSQLRGFAVNGVGPRDTGTASGTYTGDAVGGNFFAVARLEAEFPIGIPEEYGISAGLFFDAGSVWGLDNTAGTAAIDPTAYLRSVVGASIFWKTPIGPLRFNFSHAIAKQSYDVENTFEFTISTEF